MADDKVNSPSMLGINEHMNELHGRCTHRYESVVCWASAGQYVSLSFGSGGREVLCERAVQSGKYVVRNDQEGAELERASR